MPNVPGFLGLLLCLLLCACARGEVRGERWEPHAAAIREGRAAVREAMASTRATAVSVALVDDGRLVWSEGFGLSDLDARHPATGGTLYGIASVSKTLAAAAVMRLVDEGRVSLDEPIAAYIPAFDMPRDPRHRDITVRMLLSHASGLPGNDPVGAITLEPFPGYSAQVMASLRGQRLKHDPGRINAYNNDGFTMVENLVQAVSGQSYPDFVRQELLVPLGMDASRYQVEALPEGSWARPYTGETLLPFPYFNVYATGGLFSSAEDMARLAAMLMRQGRREGRQILSERTVADMGRNQRLGTFDPVPCALFAYGLGWDTVAHPGLAAAGVRAWQKGGDMEDYYGATLVVAPEERLGVVVLGASNGFSSTVANTIAERILLTELVARGRIPAMPAKLTGTPLPVKPLAAEDRETYPGFYASNSVTCRVSFAADDSLTVETFKDGWTPAYSGLKLRSDGWFAADADPLSAFRLFRRSGRSYLAIRAKYGYGHYTIQMLYGEQLDPVSALSAAWQTRRDERWMPVNSDAADFLQSAKDPSLRFAEPPGLEGYLLGEVLFRNFPDPSEDRLDGMFLFLPDGVRDLQDASVETRQDQTWLRLGTRLYRPCSSLPELPLGGSMVTIGSEGFLEWRRLPPSGRVTLAGCTAWSLHGEDLAQLAVGRGEGTRSFGGSGAKYLALFGRPGAAVTVILAAE